MVQRAVCAWQTLDVGNWDDMGGGEHLHHIANAVCLLAPYPP